MRTKQYAVDFWSKRPTMDELSEVSEAFVDLDEARKHMDLELSRGCYRYAQLCELDERQNEWFELEDLDLGEIEPSTFSYVVSNFRVRPIRVKLSAYEKKKMLVALRLARNGGPIPRPIREAYSKVSASKRGRFLALALPDHDAEAVVSFETGKFLVLVSAEDADTVGDIGEELAGCIMRIARPDWPYAL